MRLRIGLVLLLLSGCAQKQIILKSSELKPLPVAAGENASITKYKGQLNVLKFKDDRTDKTKLGMASTGMRNTDTPIYLDIPVDEYIQSRFRSELAKHGVEVSENAAYSIRGVIKKNKLFESNVSAALEKSNCEIEMEFDILPTREKTPVYHGTISMTGSGSNFALDTTSSNGAALETCTQGLAEQFLKNNDLRKRFGIKEL